MSKAKKETKKKKAVVKKKKVKPEYTRPVSKEEVEVIVEKIKFFSRATGKAKNRVIVRDANTGKFVDARINNKVIEGVLGAATGLSGTFVDAALGHWFVGGEDKGHKGISRKSEIPSKGKKGTIHTGPKRK